ncbi:MAG: GAF domain-containing protein [Proteobacteria bacterium]|nr:GAF domain-containing protein [Pseudomonadota bacterium]
MTFDLLARWGALIVALVAVAVLVGVRRRSGRLLAEAEARLRDADARARHNEALEAQVRVLTRDVGQAQSRVDEERAARVAAEEEAQRRQLLLDLGASVFGTLELTSLLPSLLKKLRERLAFHAAGIFLFTHDKTELALVAMEGLHESEMAGQLRADVNLPAIVASSDKPVLVTDAASDPRFERLVSSARVRSALYHPISSNKKVYGVICLWYHEIGSYAQRDVDLLALITAEAARAIRNAEVHQELNARLNFIVTLWEASKTLNSSSVESDQHTWRRRLEEVVRSAAFLFGAEKAVLLRYDGVSAWRRARLCGWPAPSTIRRRACRFF